MSESQACNGTVAVVSLYIDEVFFGRKKALVITEDERGPCSVLAKLPGSIYEAGVFRRHEVGSVFHYSLIVSYKSLVNARWNFNDDFE